MDPGRALIDRDPPVIVDDKARAHDLAGGKGHASLARDGRLIPVLDAELDEPGARANKARNPFRAVDDGIEGIKA
jgi:hypothetical protein